VRTTQRYSADGAAALGQVLGPGVALPPGVELDMMTCSRYVDRVERRAGTWKIAHRTVVADWKQVMPVAPGGPGRVPGWEFGRRDQDDYVFRARRELGLA
jgi:hypothetical protein